VKKVYVFVTLFSCFTLVSCTLYTENETVLNNNENMEEFEETKSLTISQKSNVTLLNSSNLNESTTKLENETKKIKAEISTLLETF